MFYSSKSFWEEEFSNTLFTRQKTESQHILVFIISDSNCINWCLCASNNEKPKSLAFMLSLHSFPHYEGQTWAWHLNDRKFFLRWVTKRNLSAPAVQGALAGSAGFSAQSHGWGQSCWGRGGRLLTDLKSDTHSQQCCGRATAWHHS